MMFCVSFNYLIILILLSFNNYINGNVLQSFLIQKKSSTTTTLYENGQLKESTIEFEANQQTIDLILTNVDSLLPKEFVVSSTLVSIRSSSRPSVVEFDKYSGIIS